MKFILYILCLFCFYIIHISAENHDLNEMKCRNQSVSAKNFIKEIGIPTDEHKFNLQLTWIGENNRKLIVVVSDQIDSNIFLNDLEVSDNFTNINDRLGNGSRNNMELILMKHMSNNAIIYFLVNSLNVINTTIYVTMNEGTSFSEIQAPFKISSIIFHPTKQKHILAIDDFDHCLYHTQDFGFNWRKIKTNVIKAKWSSDEKVPDQIFVITNDKSNDYILGFFTLMRNDENEMHRSDDMGNNWKLIKKHVFSFGIEGIFIFTSVYVNPGSNLNHRVLMVSTNSGDNWNQVKLPEITGDKFYSILDMSDGQIFLHVDEDGDTGRGTLYTSDAIGVLFSKSLEDHLYPNFEQITDFYKVESMRAVYITSVLAHDDSVKSMITFNRGAEWKSIAKPKDIECEDHSIECNLHIHNQYSIQRGVKSLPPKSVASAPGVIIAHGNVAESLQNTESKVFVSTDGGLSWRLSLNEPHHYVIGDRGSFFVAVEAFKETIYSIKLSMDEGRCWEVYNFTTPNYFVFKDLLIEPLSKDYIVAVWGYTLADSRWMTFIINATEVIPRQCNEKDYEIWTPITDQNDNCLLGIKETFQKIKPFSLCYNGIVKKLDGVKEKCNCQMDDYYCDYGYVRKGETCVKDKSINLPEIDICLRNHKEKIILLGFHKIPGDECIPNDLLKEGMHINLTETCQDDKYYLPSDLSLIKKLEATEKKNLEKKNQVLFAVMALVGVAIIIVVLTFIGKKYKVFRRNSIRYQSIQSGDIVDNDYNISNEGVPIYQHSNDVDVSIVPYEKLANNPQKVSDVKDYDSDVILIE